MEFKALYREVFPKLKKIAQIFNRRHRYLDADDLCQEMCVYLWENFKEGLPSDKNEAYVIKGCVFHILNYLRKNREKAVLLSIDEQLSEDGEKLGDILAQESEAPQRYLERKLVFEEIRNNGFSRGEKEVLSLLLQGYTVREAGIKLGISHVMVIKHKNRLIKKWQRKKI